MVFQGAESPYFWRECRDPEIKWDEKKERAGRLLPVLSFPISLETCFF